MSQSAGAMNSNEKNSFIPLVRHIIQTARTGDYAECSSALNRFLNYLQKELSRGYLPVKEISSVTYSLQTLAEMQQMKNWVAFADILEFEFMPLWQRITTAQDDAEREGQTSSLPAS